MKHRKTMEWREDETGENANNLRKNKIRLKNTEKISEGTIGPTVEGPKEINYLENKKVIA